MKHRIRHWLLLGCLAGLVLLTAGCMPGKTPETALPTEMTQPQTQPTVPPATQPPTVPETLPPTQPEPTEPRIGWVEDGGKWYYYDESGTMLTGWLGQGQDWYYLLPDGSRAVGKTEIDGETYYFGSDGVQLLLVNPWNSMPEGYTPQVVDINGWQYSNVRCIDALKQMLADCRAAGLVPYIASAYRTHGDQVFLYNRKVNYFLDLGYSEADAKKEAGTIVAVPGTSEHELGLAFDLVDNSYRNLDEGQENTAVQKWLMENSWKYGFILRYPNEKSAITGIIYEPWHYRYVGTTVAKEIYDSGLCLEEYLESLSG